MNIPCVRYDFAQTRLRYASCNAVRAAPGLGLDVSPLGVAMTRWSGWTVAGILAAMLVGTVDALVCSQLASPKRRYVFLPRDWF